MMRKLLYLLSTAVLCINGRSQQSLSLKQAIEAAIANNPTVKLYDYSQQLAGINYKQAKNNMLPDINGAIYHTINNGRSIDPFTNSYISQQYTSATYSLSAGLLLFNGFQLMNAVRQQSFAYDAAKLELQQQKVNITLNVILDYLQILNNSELLIQSRSLAEVTQKQVERNEVLNQNGVIPPATLYDLKGQLANDELTIVNSQNALDVSKLSLAQLMNVPYDKDLQVEPLSAEQLLQGYQGDVESIYQSALQQLAVVKAADYRKRSAEKGLKSIRGAYFPQLVLSGNIYTNYSSAATSGILINTVDVPSTNYVLVNGNKSYLMVQQNNYSNQKISYSDQFKNNYSSSVSLGLRIPILNYLQTRNRVTIAKINLKNESVLLETSRIQLKQGIEQAYFNMKAAEGRYNKLLEEVAAFKESFRAAEVKFNAGLGTSIDYLLVKDKYDRANINLVSAKYDYILRMKILDYYQSRPLW